MSNLNEKELQEKLQELAELEATITAGIKKYNLSANQLNFNRRLALMSAEIEKDDTEEGASYDEMAYDNQPYSNIYAPDAYNWFPSDICF